VTAVRAFRWISRRLAAFAVMLAVMLAPVAPAFAVQPDEVLRDPVLEQRARAISAELRCLVCQNQSIDDSDAPLARDLRLIVREKLTAGASDSDIRRFLVDRYGEFVLLRPPFNWHTALLWLGPFAVLLGGAVMVWTTSRRRIAVAATPLSAEEKRALDEVVGR
jgi:cytochrome c-type biogenesis protein CcmH